MSPVLFSTPRELQYQAPERDIAGCWILTISKPLTGILLSLTGCGGAHG
jgi:hypothetical protein